MYTRGHMYSGYFGYEDLWTGSVRGVCVATTMKCAHAVDRRRRRRV